MSKAAFTAPDTEGHAGSWIWVAENERSRKVGEYGKRKDRSVPVLKVPLQAPAMDRDADDTELSEYAVRVDWKRTVPVGQGIRGSGMFANPMIVCKLRSKFTLDRLTEYFDLGTDETG